MQTSSFRRAAALAATTLVAGTTIALAGPAAQPASAQTKTFSDGGGHVTTVKVKYTSSSLTVDAKVGKVTLGGDFTFWIDTVPSDPGPEYKVEVYPNSDGIALSKVSTFTSTGTTKSCDVAASADAYGSDHVVVKVPSSCLGKPHKVRVALRAYYNVPGPNVVDWAPGKHKFFGWVYRG